jgi:hypothetical protein
MKITLNLSLAPSARDRYALGWAIPATLIGLVALLLLVRVTLREFREYRTIEVQLSDVQKRSAELQNQEASFRRKLDEPASVDLFHRAKFVNRLIDQRQFSLADVSARIAGLLPEDAHLTGLTLSGPKKVGDDYMLRMGITAKNEDALETFINDLEDSPDFKDVSIINQGFQEQSSQPEQVNIVCSARYLPGIDLATGKTIEEKQTPDSK